jgi:hypothetical protein
VHVCFLLNAYVSERRFKDNKTMLLEAPRTHS